MATAATSDQDAQKMSTRPAANAKATLNSKTDGDFPLRAFFSHHKCATSWTDAILMEICYYLDIKFRIIHGLGHFRRYGTLERLVSQEKVDFLAYTNADYNEAQHLPLYRGFHVIRDPRDILVSAYFSHLHSHGAARWPALRAHREDLKSLSKEEGLLREMEFSRPWFEEMYRWKYDQPNVLELKMEWLTANPQEGFLRIFHFLGLLDDEDRGAGERLGRLFQMRLNRLNQRGRRLMPRNLPMFPVPKRRMERIPSALLSEIVQQNSFKKLSGGRKKGEENVKSHYRKGKPGDWVNHFTEEHKRVFKDKFGDLVTKLGYASDDTW